jgi:hypothetical protein
MDRAVHKVIKNEIIIISQAPKRPALPTTHPRRKYIITPNMVRKVGVKTPPKVPNFLILVTGGFNAWRLKTIVKYEF